MMPYFSSNSTNSIITVIFLGLTLFGEDIIQQRFLMPPQKLVPSGGEMPFD
jgi:hypothetical protein